LRHDPRSGAAGTSGFTVPLGGLTQAAERNRVSLEQMGDRVEISVRLGRLEFRNRGDTAYGFSVRAEGLGQLGQDGAADLPAYTTFVAVPRAGRVRVYAEEPAFEPVAYAPLVALDSAADAGVTTLAAETAPPAVEAGEPFRFGHLRLLPLKVNPVRYEAVTGLVSAARSVRVVVETEGGSGDYGAFVEPLRPVLRAGVANFDELVRWGAVRAYANAIALQTAEASSPESLLLLGTEGCAEYLIVAADVFCSGPCESDSECADMTPPYGVCGATRCVDGCFVTGCEDGLVCDQTSGRCRYDPAISCSDDLDCDPPTTVCIDGGCVGGCLTTGCGAGATCDGLTGHCAAGADARFVLDSLGTLVDHIESERSMSVAVRCYEGGDLESPDDIRDWVTTCQPTYLLLAGSDAPNAAASVAVPCRGVAGGKCTDNYYCDLDEPYKGYPPTVLCGRFDTGNWAALRTLVGTIMDYESAVTSRTPERRSITRIAWDEPDQLWANDVARQWLTEAGYHVDEQYTYLGTATHDAVVAAFQDGRNVISYAGHGPDFELVGFDLEDIGSLSNTVWPFVYSMACRTTGFGNALIGAARVIAFLGETTDTTSVENVPFDARLAEQLSSGEERTFGQIVTAARWEAFNDLGGVDLGSHEYGPLVTEQYVLLGDPGLPFRSNGYDQRGLWHFDGSTADASGWSAQADLETVPAATPAFAPGKLGQAWDADGTYCLQTQFTPMMAHLTVAFWLRATPGQQEWVVSRGPADASTIDWGVRADGVNGDLEFYTDDALAVSARFEGFGEWHHVAVTYDSGATHRAKIFVDGELVAAAIDQCCLPSGQERVRFGFDAGEGGPFTGQLDEARMYWRALDEAEIRKIAGATSSRLVAWYRSGCSSRYKEGVPNPVRTCLDSSGRGNHQESVLGAPMVGLPFRNDAVSMEFHGAAPCDEDPSECELHQFQTADNPSLSLPGRVYVSAWIYVDPNLSGPILAKDGEYGLFVKERVLTGKVPLCPAEVTTRLERAGWHHVVFGFESYGGLLLAVNGVVVDVRACDRALADTDGPLRLGYMLHGTIADVRLYRSGLTVAEFVELLRTGHTVLHLPLGSSGPTDLSGVPFDASVEGQPVTAAGRGGDLDGATLFDGVDDRMIISGNKFLFLEEESLTMSVWARFFNDSDGWILAHGDNLPAYGLWVSAAEEKLGCRVGDVTSVAFWPEGFDGEYHHVACVYDQWAGENRLYLDGALYYTWLRAGEHAYADELTIGARGTSEYLHAQIDDVRIERRPWSTEEVQDEAARDLGDRIAWWRFDEAESRCADGTTCAGSCASGPCLPRIDDDSPYGNELTCTSTAGGCPLVEGFDGRHVASDGNDYLGSTSTVPETGGLSHGLGLAFWLNLEPYPGTRRTVLYLPNVLEVSRVVAAPGVPPNWEADVPHGLDVAIAAPFADEVVTEGVFHRCVPLATHRRWAHVVLSYDGEAGHLDAFVDGARRASLRVGGDLADEAGRLDVLSKGLTEGGAAARIDDLQVFARPLTAPEALRLYTGSRPHWHWRLDMDALDEGPLAVTGAEEGAPTWQATPSWQGASVGLDGIDDALVFPHVPAFDRLADQATLSLWVRPADGCDGPVFAKGDGSSSPILVRVVENDNDPDEVTVTLNGDNQASQTVTLAFDGTELTDTWVHVLVRFRSGAASEDFHVEAQTVDGVSRSASGLLGAPLRVSTAGVTLGRGDGAEPEHFAGYVDNVQLFARELDDFESERLRASATARFALTEDYADAASLRGSHEWGTSLTGRCSSGGADCTGDAQCSPPVQGACEKGLEIDGDIWGYLHITPDEWDVELARYFTIRLEVRVPVAGITREFLRIGQKDECRDSLAIQMNRNKRVWVIVGESEQFVYKNGIFSFNNNLNRWIPIEVRYDRYRGELRLAVDGQEQTFAPAYAYHGWCPYHIQIPGHFVHWPGATQDNTGHWSFGIRNVEIHRRWVE
jgi:hypothetical protein